MRKLEDILTKTKTNEESAIGGGGEISVKTASFPRRLSVVCIGVSCLDMEFCNASKDEREDKISLFTETKYVPGGSCPQVATTLAEMDVDEVIAVTKVGKDANGDDLVSIHERP